MLSKGRKGSEIHLTRTIDISDFGSEQTKRDSFPDEH